MPSNSKRRKSTTNLDEADAGQVFSASSAPTLVLHYLDFPVAARAEPLLLALEIEELVFLYHKHTPADFLKSKGSYPFGQLPVLEIRQADGTRYHLAQSNTIMRYIGRLGTRIYPRDALLACRCDEIMDAVQDVYALIAPSNRERDHDCKVAMRQRLAATALPQWLSYFEAKLTANGSGYFVGDTLTAADLTAYQMVGWLTSGVLQGIPPTIVDGFPRLRGLRARVLEHPVAAAHAARAAAASAALTTSPATAVAAAPSRPPPMVPEEEPGQRTDNSIASGSAA